MTVNFIMQLNVQATAGGRHAVGASAGQAATACPPGLDRASGPDPATATRVWTKGSGVGRQRRLRQEPEELPSREREARVAEAASGWPRPRAAQAHRPRPGKALPLWGEGLKRFRPCHVHIPPRPTAPGRKSPLPLWEVDSDGHVCALSGSFTRPRQSPAWGRGSACNLVNSGKLFYLGGPLRERASAARKGEEKRAAVCKAPGRAGLLLWTDLEELKL